MRTLVLKLARYATVSVISTSVTLSLLGTLVYSRTLSPGWANLVGTAVGTVPSFELNRRWVWAKRDRRSLGKEILPFCALSFSGLGLSTLVVSLAGNWAQGAGLDRGWVALVSQAANVATFGTLWVLQYLLLDRLLFRRPTEPAGEPAGAMVAVHGRNQPKTLYRGGDGRSPARGAGGPLAAAGPRRPHVPAAADRR